MMGDLKDAVLASQSVALAGIKSGQEIGRRESAAKIAELVAALLAYMDDHNMAHDAANNDGPNTRPCPCDYCKQASAAIAKVTKLDEEIQKLLALEHRAAV